MKAAACMVCKQRIAKYTCIKCGSLVCDICYDRDSGMCIACKRGKVFKK
ncbi:MAG: hypothetical protein ABIH63_04325 [archaeon]